MSAAGAGVIEIRVHAEGEYRVLYVAKWKDAIHVLHAFVRRRRRPGAPTSNWPQKGTERPSRTRVMAIRQQRESDNVFAQLGFKGEEALNLRLRSEMMNALIAEIEKRDSPRRAAAQLASLNRVSPT